LSPNKSASCPVVLLLQQQQLLPAWQDKAFDSSNRDDKGKGPSKEIRGHWGKKIVGGWVLEKTTCLQLVFAK
jgi:hypothetical protein